MDDLEYLLAYLYEEEKLEDYLALQEAERKFYSFKDSPEEVSIYHLPCGCIKEDYIMRDMYGNDCGLHEFIPYVCLSCSAEGRDVEEILDIYAGHYEQKMEIIDGSIILRRSYL